MPMAFLRCSTCGASGSTKFAKRCYAPPTPKVFQRSRWAWGLPTLGVFRSSIADATVNLHRRPWREANGQINIGASPFARNHDSGNRLAPFVVGHADHGAHCDIGVLRQHVLDLARKE